MQSGGSLDVSCPGSLISNLEASGNTEGLVRRCMGQLLDAPAGAGPGSCRGRMLTGAAAAPAWPALGPSSPGEARQGQEHREATAGTDASPPSLRGK